MPRYAYRAADTQGALSHGAIDAPQEKDIYTALEQRGLSLIDCRVKIPRGGLFQKGLPLSEQVLFCRHLLALVRAGVPVHLALKDVSGVSKNRAFRRALSEIHESVMQGASLSAAFEGQDMRFDPLFSLLLRAGEKTGKLSEALGYLHESLSWKETYAGKLRGMLLYPVVQIILACVATLVLMLVAVPQIIQLLGFLGKELPWYSQILLFGVKAVGISAAGILLAGFGLALVLPALRVQSEGLAVFVDGLCLRLPLMGPLLTKLSLARLAQLFVAMLSSGVGTNESLQALPQLTKNRALRRDLEKVRAHVSDGQSFTEAFEQSLQLPTYMVRLLKVGEDGGALAESLRHLAALYQQESETTLEAILKGSSLFVTLAVGFVLAAIVMGVLYPLYQGLGAVMGQG
ncbi:MAG: type II secretion system F family protein [Proteobacteria bacterium]|nr:type II secretion system F family protein [Pseudomonadota bacterium]